jgi:hypothetical protein
VAICRPRHAGVHATFPCIGSVRRRADNPSNAIQAVHPARQTRLPRRTRVASKVGMTLGGVDHANPVVGLVALTGLLAGTRCDNRRFRHKSAALGSSARRVANPDQLTQPSPSHSLPPPHFWDSPDSRCQCRFQPPTDPRRFAMEFVLAVRARLPYLAASLVVRDRFAGAGCAERSALLSCLLSSFQGVARRLLSQRLTPTRAEGAAHAAARGCRPRLHGRSQRPRYTCPAV